MPPIPDHPHDGQRSRDELLSLVYERGRALRRRRRTATWALGSGLVVALIVTTSAVALRDDGDPVDVITKPGVTSVSSTIASTTTEPSTTVPSTTGSTLPDPGPAGPPPPVAVALDDTNHLVLVDTADGHVIRTLDTPAISTNDITDVDLSADGGTLYFSIGLAMYRMSIEGGAPEPVGQGTSPTLSPDGSLLAYTGPDSGIVVRDLTTGAERQWGPRDAGQIGSLSWSPDSSRLAYDFLYNTNHTYVLDTTSTGKLSDVSTELGPYEDKTGGGLYSPTFLDDGRIAVVKNCGSGVACVVAIDLATNAFSELVRAEGALKHAVMDPSGRHALLLNMERGNMMGPGTLSVAETGAKPRQLPGTFNGLFGPIAW
jgi:hypothetical protein